MTARVFACDPELLCAAPVVSDTGGREPSPLCNAVSDTGADRCLRVDQTRVHSAARASANGLRAGVAIDLVDARARPRAHARRC
jgi:hypothetical protein